MSTSSTSSTGSGLVTLSGLSSGLNTSSIITALTTYGTQQEAALTNQETTLNNKLSEWQTINTSLSSFASIVSGLSSPSAFTNTTASIDQTAVASVSTGTGAATGTHTLTVSSLASAQRVLSTGVSNSSAALGYAGSFALNGKTISVSSSDTLTSIASAVNSASAGVTATVINTGAGSFQLSISASSTGAANAISASDVGSGTVLESLGLIGSSPTTALRQRITSPGGLTGAGSMVYSSASEAIGTLNGVSSGSAPSGTVTIGDKTVSIDLNTMSLNDVANAINAVGPTNLQAQVVSTGGGKYQLQVVSTNSGTTVSASTFTDSDGVLANMGFIQQSFANQKSGATDASFTLDSVNYTRSSNTVTDVLDGVTLSLLSTNSSGASTPANISVSADNSRLESSVSNFVTAYNGIMDQINTQMTFTPSSTSASTTQESTQPLFGDSTLMSIQNQLENVLNLSNGSTTLAGIGITVGTSGDLTLDSSKLDSALSGNASGVAGLFSTAGMATGAGLTYSAAGASTQSSSGAGYAVNITTPASQAVATSSIPYAAHSSAETLTFGGSAFGSVSTNLTIPANASLASAISQINNNASLSPYVYASQDTRGDLVLTSVGYGSSQSFTVSSNLSSGGTGIGSGGIVATGVDIAGSLGGQPATGVGQSLLGNSANANTAGLQISYTGSSTGIVGHVAVTEGLATQLSGIIRAVTNTSTGSIAAAETSLNSQISDLEDQVAKEKNYIATYTQQLQAEFANMESVVSTLKSQQSAFDAEAGITSSSGSSSGTGSSG